MTDQILEVVGCPVNADGVAVLQAGGGGTSVVGNLPPSYFPVDATTGAIVVKFPEVAVSGDMLKSEYDPNNDGKIDINQLSGAEPTLTKGDLKGTAKQVIVNGGSNAADAIIGSDITLALPQNIATDSSPLFNAIKLDTTPSDVPSDIGTIYYNVEYRCPTAILPDGVELNIGQEETVQAIAGENINNGEVVYISTEDSADHPTVMKASNSIYDQAYRVLGMATHSALTGEHLVVTRTGLVHDVNTSSYTRGQLVYLGDTAGSITTTKPNTDKTTVRVGYVHVVNATTGEILVDTQAEMSSAGAYLDAQVRVASAAIPTSPTAFVWEAEVTDTINMYNQASGEITIPFTGQWAFTFSFNAVSAVATKSLYAAAQTWDGSAWVTSTYSTRQDAVRNGEARQVLFSSQNQFSAGTKLRFVVWGQTDLTIVTQTITTGYTVPAARLLITGVKTV